MGRIENETDPEIEGELVTLSPVNDIEECAENQDTFPNEVIFKDLLALTDTPEVKKVSDEEERKPDVPPTECLIERESIAKAGETSVVLKPPVKRKKKPVVISVLRKTKVREPDNVGNDVIQGDKINQQERDVPDNRSLKLLENIELRNRARNKAGSPHEIGFRRMKIPSVIYKENAWFPYEEENGILTYIALEKATRRYRKRLSFLGVLMLLVSIICVVSIAAVGTSLYTAWDLWFLMLFPLGLSLGVLIILFIVRLSVRPHRIISLMKHYYRVDVLAFTESSAVIYDYHDSVSDFSFHYSDFPFNDIHRRLCGINKTPVSIHDEENVISSLAKCADIWNSKKREFYEVPVATGNSLLYRCVEALLPYSIIISHSDTLRTVREMTLPASWDEEKSRTMNPQFVQFCGLRGIIDNFNNLVEEIDRSISVYHELLSGNISATNHYYSEFSRLASKMMGISQIEINDEGNVKGSGENDIGPVAPLRSLIRKFSDETKGKREWIAEEYDGKINYLQDEMETKIDNERTELSGKSSEIDFQIKEMELETEGLQKEKLRIERSQKDRAIEISEASENGNQDNEMERLELESERVRDKLDQNEKLLALLTERAKELDDVLTAKISMIEKVYAEKKDHIENEKKMELTDVEKEVNVLKGLRDEIMKIALSSKKVFSNMEEKEILPFQERWEDIKKIRNYLVTAIENDKNELAQGIKPTDDLKFTYDGALPLSFHIPFWSIQLSTGEISVLLPMLMCEDVDAGREIRDNCVPLEKIFKKFYPSQAEFEDFLAKRVRTDKDYFPSKKLMASPEEMKNYSGVFFTERFLKMVEKKGGYLW